MRLVASLSLALALAAAPRTLASPAGPPVVAVLYFDYEGKDAELGLLKKGLANMLISDLLGLDTIRIVERDRLELVLGELKLQATTKIDSASAVKAGNLLGARFLVLGGYFDAMKTLRVDAHVIEVETGRIVLAIGATGKPEEFVMLEQQLAGELRAHFAKNVSLPVRSNRRVSPRTRPAKPPAQLTARTAVEYGRALTAIDAGDKKAAKESLKKVVTEAPDFALAWADLNRLK